MLPQEQLGSILAQLHALGGSNYHLLHLCTILESFDLINDLGIPAI